MLLHKLKEGVGVVIILYPSILSFADKLVLSPSPVDGETMILGDATIVDGLSALEFEPLISVG